MSNLKRKKTILNVKMNSSFYVFCKKSTNSHNSSSLSYLPRCTGLCFCAFELVFKVPFKKCFAQRLLFLLLLCYFDLDLILTFLTDLPSKMLTIMLPLLAFLFAENEGLFWPNFNQKFLFERYECRS